MTITSSFGGAALALGIILAVGYSGVMLWRRRVPGLALGPSVRTALYLTRFAVALEYYGLRRSEISSQVEALRGDLAAVDVADVEKTLTGLGPPRTLAAEVTSGTLRPSLLRGLMWAGLAALLALGVTVLVTDAFLGGFESVAQPGNDANWSVVGLHLEATMGSNGHAATAGFSGWAHFVLPALAFVVGARLWRLRRLS